MASRIVKPTSVIGIIVFVLGLVAACAQPAPATPTPAPAKPTAAPAAAKPTAAPAAAKSTPATAAAAEFFKGKTLTWIVSSDPGSGTDLAARIVAPYFTKETGANVRVENMQADEGSNYVYERGSKDGLTAVYKSIGALTSNDILKAPGVQYEADKYIYIASVNPAVQVIAMSVKAPHKTLEDLRKAKDLKVGGTSARGSIAVAGAAILEILGLDGKVITGFSGTKALAIAMGRGEVDMIVQSDSPTKIEEDAGNMVAFAALGGERSTVLPKVPTIGEMGVKVPKELEAVYEFNMLSGQAMALPPGVPQERVDYLRGVLEKLSANKDLQRDIEKSLGSATPFVPGKKLQDTVAAIKANKGLAEQLDTLFAKYRAAR